MTKKKTKPMNGEELYKIDKLPYRVYLEAAIDAARKQNVPFMQLRLSFHTLFTDACLKDLGHENKV